MNEKKWLADQFEANRAHLRAAAYRMLGSRSEAEDAVQEAWLRLNRADTTDVGNLGGWLTTVVARICLDMLTSARARREEYVGPWLPEPVFDTAALAPDTRTELAEDLSIALLMTLDRLSALERAAFLLHDVFAFEFAEIAPIVEKTPANCRQIARRARAALDERRPRFEPAGPQQQRLLSEFMQACASGDLAGLLALLTADITLWSDGGGLAQAPGATL